MPPEGPRHPTAETPGQPSWIEPVKPVVPDHELLKRIGGGSYGDVWLARSVVGTWRAVKVVFRDRFLDARPYEREFNGIQKFEPLSRSNEGFIDVLQIGRNDAEGYFYYVMELADDAAPAGESNQSSVSSSQSQATRTAGGAPLSTEYGSLNTILDPSTYVPKTLAKALFQRGRLPVSECLELGITLNLALAHLHDAGLIHRDIKPSNIIFVGGVPKLADIGLVIEYAEARSYVGTEGFIPPEGPNSPQADLFSLGKVLYEAGMGKDRKDFPEPLSQIAEAPDSAQLLEFNTILLKACAANVRERYQSAVEMNADLALLQSGGSVRRQRKLAGQLRFVQRAGALVTAIAVLIGLGWWWQIRQTRRVRELVVEKTRLADTNNRLAEEKTRLADDRRERIVRLDIANGVRLMDASDLSGALLWFAEALPLVTNNPAEEAIHRIRIQQAINQSPRLLHVMTHVANVASGAFSPDGQRVATATGRGALQVWDAETGRILLGPTNLGPQVVGDLRFTKDGNRLLVRSCSDQGLALYFPRDGFAAVIDAGTGQEVFPRVTNVGSSAFSPDERWFAVARTNFVIEVLETSTGRHLVDLSNHIDQVTMLSFSRDGSLLASASGDKTVRLWRVPSGEPVGRSLYHAQTVARAVFSPDGRRLATAEGPVDGPGSWSIHTFNVSDGSEIGVPIQATNHISTLAFDETTGRRLITGDENRWISVWDADSHSPSLPPLTMEQSPVRCWAFSPDGIRFAIGGDDGTVCVWNIETGEPLTPRLRHTGWVESVRFSPDGTRLLTTSDDGTAKVWSLRQEDKGTRIELSSGHLNAPAQRHRIRGRTPGPIPVPLTDGGIHLIDPDRLIEIQTLRPQQTNEPTTGWMAGETGRYWAVGEPVKRASPQQLTLWTWEDGVFRCLGLPHPQVVLLMQFNADDSRLLTFSHDWVVRIWRTSDGTIERSIPIPSESLSYVNHQLLFQSFDPGGRSLMVIWHDPDATEQFQLFDLSTAQLTGKPFALRNISRGMNGARFSPDGTRLAAVGNDQQGTVIDLQTGELAAPQFKHGGDLLDLDWSPDGTRLITSGLAPSVKMWDAATGELLLSPMVMGSKPVVSARWSADGRFIVARNDENLVRVWDAATAEAVTPIMQHSGYVRWSCITPGNRLITASDPNLLRAWDLRPTTLATDVIADYAKLLSGRGLSAGGVLLPIPAKELAELNRSLRARAPQLFE